MLAKGRTGGASVRCLSMPPAEPLGVAASLSELFPADSGGDPASLLSGSFSAGRTASCFSPAAHRSCWATRSSSVLCASGSFVVFAADANDVAASPCEAAASARVAGVGEGAL